ncbi:MAG: hypothetical protein AB7F96_01490 [Beijerinckiaceae bacterium]
MTFSSRVICDPPPPATKMVRALGAALWALPVVISVACLAAVPSKTSQSLASLFKAKEKTHTLASAVVTSPRPLEPERFTKVATTPRYRSLLDLRLRNDRKFPMKMAFAAPAPGEISPAPQHPAEKVTMKAPTIAAIAPNDVTASVTFAPGTLTMRPSAPLRLAETRMFEDARAIAANAVYANGETIILAGIEPPKAGSKCRRLDGVEVDCTERAQARLTVLLMDRMVKCQVSAPQQNGVRFGRCSAGKIDIGNDLLRQRLAARAHGVQG